MTEGRISAIELATPSPPGPAPVIAPGLIDLHVHGFGGFEPVQALGDMARALARAGTTGFQPTLFPDAPGELGATAAAVWGARTSVRGGARVLGLHLEGPFVNPRAAGALPPEDLARPDPAALRAIVGASSGDGSGVRTMTLAPELAGAMDLIPELVRCDVRVSLGHSLAKAAEARAAMRAGAVGATHLYNAMSPLHHREAGLVGLALTEGSLFAEIIGDLVHVGVEAFELALAARGPRGLCLVSDALEHAGTGCDVFHVRGREHRIVDGAAFWRGPDGGESLAGSASSQLEMVRKLVARGVLSLEEALTMASETPARALGLEDQLGSLAVGKRADVLVLHGPQLELRHVFIDGQELPSEAS
jgi:N-acetylglucosamine-6-phosphate deacetylase